MSDTVLRLRFMGGLGNKLYQYCYARACSERLGCTLETEPWVGQQIFTISDPTISNHSNSIEVLGYFQKQTDINYTRSQARHWLQFRPEILESLRGLTAPAIAAHRRLWDTSTRNAFPRISRESYQKACKSLGYDPDAIEWFERGEEGPWVNTLNDDPSFLPDFVKMMRAGILFRGNSTFSWWAATLGTCRVYSPVIDGLTGPGEINVTFVEGNCPRTANNSEVTELKLEE